MSTNPEGKPLRSATGWRSAHLANRTFEQGPGALSELLFPALIEAVFQLLPEARDIGIVELHPAVLESARKRVIEVVEYLSLLRNVDLHIAGDRLLHVIRQPVPEGPVGQQVET